MATLTVRYDIRAPRFVHGFIYEGDETERAALKKAMREMAIKAGIRAETWLQSAVIGAPEILPDAAPDVRQKMNSAITAWVLDQSAGHPTHHGTIDEFLNDCDFLVTITKVAEGEISCEVHATPGCAGSAGAGERRPEGTCMASQHGIERDRGAEESRQQIAVLREKWPLAFPPKPHDVRPLAIGAAGDIAAAMGWSLPYTLGVLCHWKMAPTYCRAVLSYDQRIALDGAPAEPVDTEAKELAKKQLARLEARKAAKMKPAAPPRATSRG